MSASRLTALPATRFIGTDGVYVRDYALAENVTTGAVDVEPMFVVGAGLEPLPRNGVRIEQPDAPRRSVFARLRRWLFS